MRASSSAANGSLSGVTARGAAGTRLRRGAYAKIAEGRRFGDVTGLKAFRRACYDAAQRTGGKLSEFRISNDVTPNFHQAC